MNLQFSDQLDRHTTEHAETAARVQQLEHNLIAVSAKTM